MTHLMFFKKILHNGFKQYFLLFIAYDYNTFCRERISVSLYKYNFKYIQKYSIYFQQTFLNLSNHHIIQHY